MSNSEIQATYDELKNTVVGLEYNYARTVKGVKSSHTALRSQLGEAKKLIDTLRRLVLQHQKALPTKARKKKVDPEETKSTTSTREAQEEDGNDSGVASEPEELVPPKKLPAKKRRGRPRKPVEE